MNKLPSGGIAVGSPGSIARLENSKMVCTECAENYYNSVKEIRVYVKPEIAIGGDCDCCGRSRLLYRVIKRRIR